jgi:hypothetical protein
MERVDMLRIGYTKRRKIPIFYFFDDAARIWDLDYFLKSFFPCLKLLLTEVKSIKDRVVTLKDGWKLDVLCASCLARETTAWKYYLPPFSLEGKTVLDIGAGCGETARFFLKNGAKRVLCVEKNQKYTPYLFENQIIDSRIEVFPEGFNPNHLLKLDYDFVKIDIEGYETLILNWIRDGIISKSDDLKPTILETHSTYIEDEFKKLGFKILLDISSELKIMSNIKGY